MCMHKLIAVQQRIGGTSECEIAVVEEYENGLFCIGLLCADAEI